MKKVLKISAIVLGVLIVLMLLTPFLFKGKITQIAKDELNKSLNAKIDFSGMSLGLFKNFPNFTFTIKDLSVVGLQEFEGDTLFAAPQLSFTLDLQSVLAGNYEVTKIKLQEPLINLLVLENEKANWDIALASEEDSMEVEEADTTNYKLVLESFEIENARVIYDDKAYQMYSLLKGFNLTLKGDLTAHTAELELKSSIQELTYEMENISYMKKSKIDFLAEIDANLDSSKYTFRDNKLLINGLEINFEGFVAMPSDDIYMDLRYQAPKADLKSLMSLVPAFYMEGYEDVKTEGKVAFNGWAKGVYGEFSMPAFELNIDIDKGRFQYPDLPQAVENIYLKTKILSPSSDMNDMQIDISRFSFKIINNPMEVKLKLRTPLTDPDIDAQFKGKFDLASLVQVYPLDSGMHLSGLFTTDIRLKGKQSSLDKEQYQDFVASGSMQLADLHYQDKDLPEGIVIHRAAMSFTPQFIDMSSFNATYNHNTMEANGKLFNYMGYAFSDGILRGEVNLKADYLNLDELMASEETTAAPDTNVAEKPLEAFEVPKNIQMVMQCDIAKMKYDVYDLKAVFGKISIMNQQVNLDKLHMELLGGKMEMSGFYNSSNLEQPLVHFILGISDFNIKQTYQAMDMVKQLAPIMQYAEGTFSSLLSYEGKLDKAMNPDLNSVSAKGILSTSKLSIKGAKSIEELANTLKINELKNLSTDAMAIPFEIKDGKLLVKTFETKVNGIPMKASGVTYLNQNIDYDLNMKIPREKLGGQANSTLNHLSAKAKAMGVDVAASDQIDVQAKMTGTTTKPKIGLNFKETANKVEDQIKQEIVNQTEEIKKQAYDEAQKLKTELENKAKEELKKQQEELERKKKEAEERAKKKLQEEAKKRLGKYF
jgi:hypothetical protein